MKRLECLAPAVVTLILALPMGLIAQEAPTATPEQATPAATDSGLVELKIDLPKPLFVGTPTNIISANLEPATGKSRQPFMVPPGVVLLSRDATVTSSDSAPIIGELEMITDGDKEGSDGSYVELGPGKQWVQIELEQAAEISAIVIWHYHSQARAYQDVVVQSALDKDFLEEVHTIFNNDHDNSAGLGIGQDKEWIETYEGRLLDAKGHKARFIRLYSNGSTSSPMNQYIEVEIYGRPVE